MKTILENTKKFLKEVYICYRDITNDMYNAWFDPYGKTIK